jgi:hypothetical protein
VGCIDKPEHIANNVLESRMVGKLNAYKAVPIALVYEVTEGAAEIKVFDSNAPYKFEVIDVVVQPRGASANGTMKLTNGTSDITDTIACATDKTLDRAATIDNAYSTISQGGSLSIVCAGDAVASTIGLVTIWIIKK